MNLCIDIGNTRTKAGLFKGNEMISYYSAFTIQELQTVYENGLTRCLISKSGTNEPLESALKSMHLYHLLTSESKLPISMDYSTPETLGADRLAKAVAAHVFYPNQHVIIIDAGTCLTLDLIDKNGVFQGGLIAPGAFMRLAAMHQYTSALPLVEFNKNITFPGKSTEESMQVGVYQSIVYEINGYIKSLEDKLGQVIVVDCSSHKLDFEKGFNYQIFAHSKFVLQGLNIVASQHV